MLRFALFDLDNTLYPQSSGLWEAIGQRISLYMTERLGVHPDEVDKERRHFLEAFGTTLNALRHYYGVDPDEFLEFVHDLPLREYLRPDPKLDDMLARIPLAKVIFTNADAPHVQRVLGCLGIARHFEQVIDIHALEFINKPHRGAYERVLGFISALPEECIFIEDSAINLFPARHLGMVTVLVQNNGEPVQAVDHRINSIGELERLIASLNSRSQIRQI